MTELVFQRKAAAPIASGAALLAWAVLATGASAQEAPSPPQAVHPGAPGEPSRILDAEELAELRGRPHTEADVRFMQMMIVHHEQAIEMTSLVPERAEREAIRQMARRMDISQADEIVMMERWLRARGEPVEATVPHEPHAHGPDMHGPDAHGAHARHPHPAHADMPGMLTPEQMERLRAAKGPEFDRLFLEYMIFHHEGAIEMVEELFRHPGAGQEVEMFLFASHVQADQQVEIERMRRMLAADSDG